MKSSSLILITALALTAPHASAGDTADYVDIGKSRLELVRIPAGTFRMGTDLKLATHDNWTNDVERPVHEVKLSKDFWMGKFAVTQGQWQEAMGKNPSYFQKAGPDAPVESVSWNDCQAFLAKVNASQKRWTVRLPTEGEWEYAARAGTTGETYGPAGDVEWYRDNGSDTTHPVGKKAPNAFGLYDMLGNVWQWCQDWFSLYSKESSVDPKGPPEGQLRVMRGGCFYCDAIHARAARRNRDPQEHLWRSIGFRVVATPRE
jgi:formylglycine-generating enzyme required for sulfatase activity